MSAKLRELFDLKSNELNLVRDHKLAGLYKDNFPIEFKKNWLLNQAYLDEISSWKLPQVLRGVLLKGDHLLNHYYSHIGQRFMGGIIISRVSK